MKQLDQLALRELQSAARDSTRRRSHLLWHRDHADSVQRLLIGMQPDSYLCPHRHPPATGWEALVLVRGAARLLLFDDLGRVDEVVELSTEGPTYLAEYPAQCWHSLVAMHADTCLLEFKPGPMPAVEFAAWAPRESDPAAAAFLRRLAVARGGERLATV